MPDSPVEALIWGWGAPLFAIAAYYGLRALRTWLSYRAALRRRLNALKLYGSHPQYWRCPTCFCPPESNRPRR